MIPFIIAILILLVFFISVSWPNLVGAPWVPTSMSMVQKMLELAEVGSDDVVYDLGCGDGRTVLTAARVYGARAVGIEIDPLRYLWCQILVTLLGLRDRVTIKYGNFFSHDLSQATVVTCYLLANTNKRLEGKLIEELPAGARVVSNTFSFPGMQKVRQDGDARLYLANT
jgi:16S rRNA A1518/A1519 N6-dimethyltransferase RsmA/KsgA/DIM1 with predicted DNA glycosylase/AP lyase activity